MMIELKLKMIMVIIVGLITIMAMATVSAAFASETVEEEKKGLAYGGQSAIGVMTSIAKENIFIGVSGNADENVVGINIGQCIKMSDISNLYIVGGLNSNKTISATLLFEIVVFEDEELEDLGLLTGYSTSNGLVGGISIKY